jgi:hypothetical protein
MALIWLMEFAKQYVVMGWFAEDKIVIKAVLFRMVVLIAKLLQDTVVIANHQGALLLTQPQHQPQIQQLL